MKKGYVMRCNNCRKEYDLIRATDICKDDSVRCPHCNKIVGKRNN